MYKKPPEQGAEGIHNLEKKKVQPTTGEWDVTKKKLKKSGPLHAWKQVDGLGLHPRTAGKREATIRDNKKISSTAMGGGREKKNSASNWRKQSKGRQNL